MKCDDCQSTNIIQEVGFDDPDWLEVYYCGDCGANWEIHS